MKKRKILNIAVGALFAGSMLAISLVAGAQERFERNLPEKVNKLRLASPLQANAQGILDESLAGADAEVDLVLVPPGEQAKSMDMAAGLWKKLLELGIDRTSIVVAVGYGACELESRSADVVIAGVL